jgi:hypothetical protein
VSCRARNSCLLEELGSDTVKTRLDASHVIKQLYGLVACWVQEITHCHEFSPTYVWVLPPRSLFLQLAYRNKGIPHAENRQARVNGLSWGLRPDSFEINSDRV